MEDIIEIEDNGQIEPFDGTQNQANTGRRKADDWNEVTIYQKPGETKYRIVCNKCDVEFSIVVEPKIERIRLHTKNCNGKKKALNQTNVASVCFITICIFM
jgi:hypothetical protein